MISRTCVDCYYACYLKFMKYILNYVFCLDTNIISEIIFMTQINIIQCQLYLEEYNPQITQYPYT